MIPSLDYLQSAIWKLRLQRSAGWMCGNCNPQATACAFRPYTDTQTEI